MGNDKFRLLVPGLLLAGTSLMCSIFTPSVQPMPEPGQKAATISSLQQTMKVMERTAITATPEPTRGEAFPTLVIPPSGTIIGKVGYPSEEVPPLHVVAINIQSGEIFSTEVFNQGLFSLHDMPPGKYHVLAYPVQPVPGTPNQAAGYTLAVPCGLEIVCTDHSLIPIDVTAGTTLTDINPLDWFAPEGTFPADPTR